MPHKPDTSLFWTCVILIAVCMILIWIIGAMVEAGGSHADRVKGQVGRTKTDSHHLTVSSGNNPGIDGLDREDVFAD